MTITARATLPVLLGVSLSLVFGAVVAPVPTAAAASSDDSCTVSDAELQWGFKETFRSYVSGTIANGEWTVADGASYETPTFGWSDGTGTLSGDDSSIAFAGSITFTGHGEILNTTVSNPVIVLDNAASGHLLVDVTGTTQEGAAVHELGVDFAQLDLGAAIIDSDTAGVLIYTDIPAVLTAAGSAAFGTYLEGEPLDPITLRVEASEECIAAAIAPAQELWWYLLALGGVVIAAVTVLLVVRQNRSTEPGVKPVEN